jgi:hypothetical protein
MFVLPGTIIGRRQMAQDGLCRACTRLPAGEDSRSLEIIFEKCFPIWWRVMEWEETCLVR